ncbi:MAG: phosphodiester glycosidase family protein [Planctomycetes bacterium]|nr:phosphodiester glycosidase family protein [Planctomycetota bacterium]
MRTRRNTISIVILVLFSLPWLALAEFPSERPFSGITYRQETRQDPPMRLFVAQVDLANPKVRVDVSPGGPDPDGAGEWETTLMVPTKVAARERFDLAVNGDFFSIPPKPANSTTRPSYRSEVWAGAIGPAVTDGKAWSVANKKTPCLIVRKNGRVSIDVIDKPPADAAEVIAGNVMLVEKGKPVIHESKAKHPRTVVGLNDKNTKLTILVVDGRQRGVSIGMSYEELAKEMIRLGCHTAINLDGGGSSVMVMRNPETNEYKILNKPSDGRERPVANVLGITVGNGEKKK